MSSFRSLEWYPFFRNACAKSEFAGCAPLASWPFTPPNQFQVLKLHGADPKNSEEGKLKTPIGGLHIQQVGKSISENNQSKCNEHDAQFNEIAACYFDTSLATSIAPSLLKAPLSKRRALRPKTTAATTIKKSTTKAILVVLEKLLFMCCSPSLEDSKNYVEDRLA